VENIGKTQYNSYVEKVLIKGEVSIADSISRNKLDLFSSAPKKTKSADKLQIDSLKSDCTLFARLYISCQARDGDMSEFFKHENQACPPSLSKNGMMRGGNKSDLVSCLVPKKNSEVPNDIDGKVFDGAAIVHLLQPKGAKTFGEYVDNIFIPYIERQMASVQRVDFVWDVYEDGSLKESTQEKRGSGKRRKVATDVKIPHSWNSFLHVKENKQELFKLLANAIVKMETEGQRLYTTDGDKVLSNPPLLSKERIQPSTQMEADGRLILHASDASSGYKKIMIRTVDTDVVILAVAFFHQLNIEELWVAFGTRDTLHYIPIHTIVAQLGRDKSMALLMFHAVTGCDTVSFFSGRGKKTAWDIWNMMPNLTGVFLELTNQPSCISSAHIAVIERFIVLMYSKTSEDTSVNDARLSLLCQGNRSIENIPPTMGALEEHIKRAVYQAGHLWSQAMVKDPILPSPGEWGWEKAADKWKPM